MCCLQFVRFASRTAKMELGSVVKRLESLASPKLAESWDNTGLLVEPSGVHVVKTLLLTNDLTESVANEAVDVKADMVLSYHPPIFQPLKCLVQRSWKQRIIVKCIENHIAVYSPHTSYDTVEGGVNDWLISPFGGAVEPLSVWTNPTTLTRGDHSATITVDSAIKDLVLEKLNELSEVTVLGTSKLNDESNVQLKVHCSEKGLCELVKTVRQFEGVLQNVEVVHLSKPPMPNHGRGRRAVLDNPITIQQSVELIKSHLKLPHLRLALAVGKNIDSEVKSVAVCAGSGSSVLANADVDLYVTGEMSHHEVLDANHNGASVVLCEHSNTERGFLTVLQRKLDGLFEGLVDVRVSARDQDPLQIL